MEDKFSELSEFIEGLKIRYLSVHLDPRKRHRKLNYDLDVRAFCLFSHAAIEQYFEELAEHTLDVLMRQWNSGYPMSKTAVISLMSLLMSESLPKIAIEDDESKPQVKPLHMVSQILRERVKAFPKKISDNHGASLKYLRAMFAPLGIDIDPGPSADSALSKLASSRGAYAHRRTPAKSGFHVYKPMSPKDALTAAMDCLQYCKLLLAEVPVSPPKDSYSAEGMYLSAHRAKVANVLKEIADQKLRQGRTRLPR